MIYNPPAKWLRCVMPSFGRLMVALRIADFANNYELCSDTFAILLELNLIGYPVEYHTLFTNMYQIEAVVDLDCFLGLKFTWDNQLWHDIYDEIDAGRGPDLTHCWWYYWFVRGGGSTSEGIPATPPTGYNQLP